MCCIYIDFPLAFLWYFRIGSCLLHYLPSDLKSYRFRVALVERALEAVGEWVLRCYKTLCSTEGAKPGNSL